MSLKENKKMKRLLKSLTSVVAVSVALGLGACKPTVEEDSAFTVGGRFATDGVQLGGFGADELDDLLNPSEEGSARTGGAWDAPLVFNLDVPATDGKIAADAGTSLTVGSTTELSASFLAGWTNNAADNNVRNLIFGGLDTVVLTELGTYEYNPVALEKVEVLSADNFDRTYKFKLREDLVYSISDQGSDTVTTLPVKAEDYVFSLLFNSSADLVEASKNTAGVATNKATAGIDLVGYETFNKGVGEGALASSAGVPFEGVRLLGEYEFSITVNGDMFPYFYEKTLSAVAPAPMSLYLGDGAAVVDSEEGAKVTGITKALIAANVDNGAKGGQRWFPTFYTGPYMLSSYNDTTKAANLKVNPNFKGQYKLTYTDDENPSLGLTKGLVFPKIENLVMVKTVASTEMSDLSTGTVGLLAQVNGGTTINEGKALTGISHHAFERNGFGMIHFHSDIGPTQYVEVRQAMAYLLDRNAFAASFTLGYGGVVHGPYGLAQWMYKDRQDELTAKLNPYAKNVDTARKTLIAGGWVLDSKGNAYEGTGVRHKLMQDGTTLMPLELEWLSTPDNPVSELIATMLPSEAVKVGMKINQHVQEFSVLLGHYYGDADPREYHMFNLASNFTPVYDQYYAFHPGYLSYSNVAMLTDARLFRAYKDLREVDSTNTEEYADKFVQATVEWNRLLPEIPLYSDLYHAFYRNDLKDLRTTSLWNWDMAVVDAYIDSAD